MSYLEGEVSTKVDRLLGLGATTGSPARVSPALPPGCSALEALLQQKNGLFVFESALHILGDVDQPSGVHDLESWNEPSLWREEYSFLSSDAFYFAQDIFGGQFGLMKDGSVVSLDPETGESRRMAPDLEAWAGVVLEDWDFVTGYTYAKAWQDENGALPMGQRLCPKIPFVFGGAYEAANLYACDAAVAMRAYGYVARHIHGLPDGAKVRFVLVD